jgi:hypothetical protein
LTKNIFLYIITTKAIILVVIAQITLEKVMQILEGIMSFVDRYNLITEIFNFYIILEKIKERR